MFRCENVSLRDGTSPKRDFIFGNPQWITRKKRGRPAAARVGRSEKKRARLWYLSRNTSSPKTLVRLECLLKFEVTSLKTTTHFQHLSVGSYTPPPPSFISLTNPSSKPLVPPFWSGIRGSNETWAICIGETNHQAWPHSHQQPL